MPPEQLFREAVKRWVQSQNSRRDELAGKFEVHRTWVDSWWIGNRSPHPLLQAQVVKWIQEKDPELVKDLV